MLSHYSHSFLFLFFVVVGCATVLAENDRQQKISGVVRDQSGEPLPGVNVVEKGTRNGTITDVDGKFELTLKDGNAILSFSYIGFTSIDVPVENKQNLRVKMREDVTQMDEVVVIGYGTTTKKEVTGSISSLKEESFVKGNISNPMQLLQGQVAGMNIVKPNGGDPNGEFKVQLRGMTTLSGGASPLVVIDGIIGGSLESVNPEEIESIDVLKDGSASTYTAVPMQFAAGPDGSDFSEDQTKFSDVCVYDTEKAADYWAKGLEELGKSEITLDMVVDADDAPQKVAQVLKEQWETTLPGLTVNLVVEPKKQRVEDMQNGNFQLGLTRWGPDYADPMTYLGMWVTDNSNNYGLWSSADYDAIIEECTTGDLCTDAEGRWARLYDAEKVVMDEAVIYPLYTQCNAEMLSSKVTGVEYHPVAINRVYKDAVKTE